MTAEVKRHYDARGFSMHECFYSTENDTKLMFSATKRVE